MMQTLKINGVQKELKSEYYFFGIVHYFKAGEMECYALFGWPIYFKCGNVYKIFDLIWINK